MLSFRHVSFNSRNRFLEAKARALHIPHCLDIPIGILGYNPSLSPLGQRQVEDLCRQTVSNIQARAQLLITSPVSHCRQGEADDSNAEL